MHPNRIKYIQQQISDHATLFFDKAVSEILSSDLIRFLPYDQAVNINGKKIVVPIDIPVPNIPQETWQVIFNNTKLTLWNKIDKPTSVDWQTIPNETTPLWYKNSSGTLMPAWNLFGNIFSLLTFEEEKHTTQRDHHGRFNATLSPRYKAGILEVPAFNEAVAAIIAAIIAIKKDNENYTSLDEVLKPPMMVLSHDCDSLHGNDIWTQMIRAYRIFQPLLKIKRPKVENFWWIIRNMLTPQRFYYDNVTGMIDLERCFNFTSTFYLLNGNGGRFGARSGNRLLPDLCGEIPDRWRVGIHYNYDTFLKKDNFQSQLNKLNSIVQNPLTMGRAHYLKFDPEKSFEFLQSFGVKVDESSGYSDCIGYRNGIAGGFRIYDTVNEKERDIWEVPLTVMEITLLKQYGSNSLNKIVKHLSHLKCIGGALSIVFHPGQFFNPELKPFLGLYHKILIECRQLGVSSITADSFINPEI